MSKKEPLSPPALDNLDTSMIYYGTTKFIIQINESGAWENIETCCQTLAQAYREAGWYADLYLCDVRIIVPAKQSTEQE